MGKKTGKLIKEARTGAGLTQEQLARKVRSCSASDISRAERGEKNLTQDQLKQIAKATGVTQKSLLDAARSEAPKTNTSSSTSSANKTSIKVTATEKKLVELYRAADSSTKKAAMNVLKGTDGGSLLENLLGGALDALGGKRTIPGEEEPSDD